MPQNTGDDRHIYSFDPWLGLATGETWWELGRKMAPLLDLEGAARRKYLTVWVRELKANLIEEKMPDAAASVTIERLEHFVTTVCELLKKKHDGLPIRHTVRRLINKERRNIVDAGQYLEWKEPGDTFWAVEFEYLFNDLKQPKNGAGWLNAVTTCANCDVFFIKQRIDQRFHSDACRMRAANRRAYDLKNPNRAHTKRGRPRAKGGQLSAKRSESITA